ncbi:MAG: hypothetical protein KDE27_17830 [Planctomycetes bacterium]|nr:hypothetical protein [Planctomycetota bacterium]
MTSTATTAPPASLGTARQKFDGLRGRVRRGIWIEAFGLLGLLLVAYAVPTLLTDRFLRLEFAFRLVLLLTFAFVVIRMLRRRLFVPLAVTLDDDEMALAVERRAPGTRQALISSLQFDRQLAGAGGGGATHAESRELMAAVVADTSSRLDAIPFGNAIDSPRVRKYLGGILLAVGFFVGWSITDAGSLGIWARRNLLLSNVDWPRYTRLAFADAGDAVRLPQGDALTVRVAADGELPEQVFLNYVFAGGESGVEPMSATGDGEFTLTLDAVLEDVVLTAEGGDAEPVELRVTIVERPRIEDLAITIDYPSYMEREPELVPATEGDVRLPRGSTLRLAGRSHKPLTEAFLLFGNDEKQPLALDADGHSFAGTLVPPNSGLLVVDVIDTDRLGAGSPPKLLLRIGEDLAPKVDLRLRGIGALIASHARIPGTLKVKDDYGLRAIDAAVRITSDTVEERPQGSDEPPPEVPFENAAATYDDPIATNALRYETETAVDLRQWNPDPDENSEKNRIRPGMQVALRFGATDNFGPGEPHHGYGETLTFRVVTRERLQEDLRRRQVEQRQELEKVILEHQAGLLELREIVDTVLQNAIGDRERLVVARLKTLARQQVALGRRAAFIAESYQRILWEYENNRLIEPRKVREIEALIPVPLEAVGKEAFPATGRLVDTFAGVRSKDISDQTIAGYVDIEQRLLAVFKEMRQAETLAAILEQLRVVIKIEESVKQEVEDKARASEQSVLGGPKTDKPNDKKR